MSMQTEMIPRNWQEYDLLRIDRIRQQRQRMENMKDVIEQYTKIIRDLQFRNKELFSQNQECYKYQKLYNEMLVENKELAENYRWATTQLANEKQRRQVSDQIIEKLKQQLYYKDYKGYLQPSSKMQSELVSHDDMLVAYESLRQEMYIVQKENYELKEALRGQSNLFYESDKFKVLKQKVNDNENQYTQEKPPKYEKSASRDSKDKQNKPRTPKKQSGRIRSEKKSHQSTYKKIQISEPGYKEQFRKQNELLERYKQTEQQHFELIELLKSKTRCPCHTEGKSKKTINSKKYDLSFQNVPLENRN